MYPLKIKPWESVTCLKNKAVYANVVWHPLNHFINISVRRRLHFIVYLGAQVVICIAGTQKSQNWDPSMQVLVRGETLPLPHGTSHLIKHDLWLWHIIDWFDEIEDESNWQWNQVRLPLCTEQKAIIIITLSKHRTEECPPHHPRSREPACMLKVCQLTKAEFIALPSFLFLRLRFRTITPGRNGIAQNSTSSGLPQLALEDLKWGSCCEAMNEASLSVGKEEELRDWDYGFKFQTGKNIIKMIIALSELKTSTLIKPYFLTLISFLLMFLYIWTSKEQR